MEGWRGTAWFFYLPGLYFPKDSSLGHLPSCCYHTDWEYLQWVSTSSYSVRCHDPHFFGSDNWSTEIQFTRGRWQVNLFPRWGTKLRSHKEGKRFHWVPLPRLLRIRSLDCTGVNMSSRHYVVTRLFLHSGGTCGHAKKRSITPMFVWLCIF